MVKGGPAGAACLLPVGPRQRAAGRAADAGPAVPHADPGAEGRRSGNHGGTARRKKMPSPGGQVSGMAGVVHARSGSLVVRCVCHPV